MCPPRKKDYELIADILGKIRKKLNNPECSKLIIEIGAGMLMQFDNFDHSKFVDRILQW